jgi:aminoglycoside phosphotransferase (APT) family kinase protein
VDDHGALIARLLPDAVASVRRIEGGWAYATYEVDGEWIVQVPELAGEDDSLRKQIGLLPELARELSAPIPVPEAVSLDPPAMAYRRIEGEPMAAGRSGFWPERLGRFLYDLHMVPPEIVGMRAESPAGVRAAMREEIDVLSAAVLPLLEPDERPRAEAMCAAFLGEDANWRFAPCLTHGDIGPEHVLLTPGGDLAGVLDWGDCSVGDPAWDFAWMLHAMPAEAERALAAYGGPPDERFRARARALFALMPWHEVKYGVLTGRPSFVESGLAGLRERGP